MRYEVTKHTKQCLKIKKMCIRAVLSEQPFATLRKWLVKLLGLHNLGYAVITILQAS